MYLLFMFLFASVNFVVFKNTFNLIYLNCREKSNMDEYIVMFYTNIF